jgi:hypothetical protein
MEEGLDPSVRPLVVLVFGEDEPARSAGFSSWVGSRIGGVGHADQV